MTRLTMLAVGLLGMPQAGSAQVAANRTAEYLFQTDARDARALWVNPSGPAITRSASIFADVVVRHATDGASRLGQVTAGFSSRGLSFGYQYDDFDTAVGHTYRLGVAGASGSFAAGFASAWYRGGTSAWGYDVGASYVIGGRLVLGATAANIGQPVVRGTKLDFTLIPGITVMPLGRSVALSALGRFGGIEGYALGLHWDMPWRVQSGLLARVDTDRSLDATAFTFGLSIGGRDQVGLVATTPRDLSRVDAASVYGVATRQFRR